ASLNLITSNLIRTSFQQSFDMDTPINNKKYPLPDTRPRSSIQTCIVSLPNLSARPSNDPNHVPWWKQSSNEEESSSESKSPINDIEKDQEDAADALQQLASSIPPIPSLSSNPALHNQPPVRKYGKQK